MLLDVESLRRSSVIHPQVIEFAQANPAPPPDWEDPVSIKAAVAEVSRLGLLQAGPPEPSLVEEYVDIPMRDGHLSRTKVYRPAQMRTQGSPVIVNIFGGGFIAGDCDVFTPICRAWVRVFDAVVFAQHATEIHADPSRGFIVGGVSAGAVASAFITSESQTRSLAHPITGQWLSVPSLFKAEDVPEKYKPHYISMTDNKDAPVLPTSSFTALKRHIEWDDTSPMRYPALYPPSTLAKLPRTYLQADGLDPLRDDALIFHEMLVEAGVDAKVDLYEGCPHAHFAFMPGIEICRKAEMDIMIGMGWLLGTESDAEGAGRAFLKPEA